MLPTFPPEALAAMKQAAQSGKVYINDIPPVPGQCPNCGGSGRLAVSFEATKSSESYLAFDDGYGQIRVRTVTYPCPICSERDRQIEREYAWAHSGIDAHERDWRIDYIENMPGKESALMRARELLAMTPKPCGLYIFHGDYGRGKTGILKSLTAQFILAGVTARYYRAADLLGEIRSTYGDQASVTEDQIVNQLGSLFFLAVDEVDRVSMTDWSMATLMRILDTRYARRGQVATAIATNARPDQMSSEWGYLQSRLRDGERVPMDGQDLRG